MFILDQTKTQSTRTQYTGHFALHNSELDKEAIEEKHCTHAFHKGFLSCKLRFHFIHFLNRTFEYASLLENFSILVFAYYDIKYIVLIEGRVRL